MAVECHRTFSHQCGAADERVGRERWVKLNDPLLLIPAMAYVTRNLGFGVTCAVSYEHPYMLARRLSTLDHLTGGKVEVTIDAPKTFFEIRNNRDAVAGRFKPPVAWPKLFPL
jgi:hypothetical protein